MKISPFRSITAKLFYLSVALVASTVAMLALVNSKRMMENLQNQVKDRALSVSDSTKEGLDSLLDSWQSQMGLVAQSWVNAEMNKEKAAVLASFLGNDQDFLSIQLFVTNGTKAKEVDFKYTDFTEDTRFGRREAYSVAKDIRRQNSKRVRWFLKKRIKDGVVKEYHFVENMTHKIELPVLNFTKVIEGSGDSKKRMILVLTTWQDKFIERLGQSQIIKTMVLNARGRVVSSADSVHLLKGKSFKKYGIMKEARKGGSNQGYNPDYKGDKTNWTGAYSRSPKYHFFVLVQQDRESAFSDVRETIIETVKWGALFILLAIMVSFLGAESITKNLKEVTAATVQISAGDFDLPIRAKSGDEIGYLAESVGTMAAKIKNLLATEVEQAHISAELATAQTVQDTIFPKPNRGFDVLRVSGFNISASQTGGDWWGHYSTGDGVEYVFVADAMGHGVPAALVTAMAYSGCATLVHMLSESKEIYTPSQILERLNRVIVEAVEGTISMTFFALMVDYHKGEITFANAGHNLPVMIPSDENDDRIKKKIKSLARYSPLTPVTLKEQGTILGVEFGAKFTETTMPLRPGDKFFLYSDGLIECKSPQGEMWKMKGLRSHLMQNIEGTPDDILKSVVNEAMDFFADEPRDDDVTVVVAEFPHDAVIGGYRDDDVHLASDKKGRWVSYSEMSEDKSAVKTEGGEEVRPEPAGKATISEVEQRSSTLPVEGIISHLDSDAAGPISDEGELGVSLLNLDVDTHEGDKSKVLENDHLELSAILSSSNDSGEMSADISHVSDVQDAGQVKESEGSSVNNKAESDTHFTSDSDLESVSNENTDSDDDPDDDSIILGA